MVEQTSEYGWHGQPFWAPFFHDKERLMKIICFLKKKDGLSSEQFMNYYESNHAPLATKLLPFFSSYERKYVIKDKEYKPGHLNEELPPVPVFDVITEISFGNRADYEGMLAALKDPVIGKQIADDEENFLDRKAMVMYFVDERTTPVDVLMSARAQPSPV
ncbi:EthD domain-containing protein [Massilia niabensis]|uniref:EthD domain-containing protein n=1 Tax=Massilia niabensis TaxID=544910 RepID=A0ABW0LCK1_9BURK